MAFVHEVAALVRPEPIGGAGCGLPRRWAGRYATPGSSPFITTSLAPVPMSFWIHWHPSSTCSILVVSVGQYFAGSAPRLGSQHTTGGGTG